MIWKAAVTVLLLAYVGCAPEPSEDLSYGAVVGRVGNSYIVREFKFDNNVHCYTNGSSISCLQLKVQ